MVKKSSLRLGIDLGKSHVMWISQLVCLRKQKGLSQADVAKKIDVDQSTISRLENQNSGERNVQTRLLEKYARAIGAYVGHVVIDAEAGDSYQRLQQELEEHTRALITQSTKRSDAKTVYQVTDIMSHNSAVYSNSLVATRDTRIRWIETSNTEKQGNNGFTLSR
ncbi:hypothetical protein N24_0466 [Corynebacterium suranareeae]|uniref:HTH cro/C1-type domain-containing protein n=1 Tax=Corynebacterium suranareeae TaxID=2506452 RepID=A0A169RPC7_9CORY|nr:helix-turn-helix transcriptional regulator [Corynebacterium suranareeae]BAU94728.1 hypothetical protein N24_0466 [Corynebacterium suranareeae]